MPTVKGPINYGRDGKEIPPGTVFEVPADEAEHLISRYGFELIEEPSTAEPSDPAGKTIKARAK